MGDFTQKLRPRKPDGPSILLQERTKSNISVDALAHHLLSYDGYLDRQLRILPLLEQEPLFNKMDQANLSRIEVFKLALARAKLLRRIVDENGWNIDDYKMAETLIDDVSPYYLHMHMFVTTIREQASDSQKSHWLSLIEDFRIIGAYAQTELGHGSNVQGLELEARWDPKKKEFILHSPTLTASKWWNGSLGRIANHAIVVAQLLLPRSIGKDSSPEYVSYGPHPFIVQVRDMKTHQPLNGIVIGDIGPKLGYATIDNAYMLFDNFRVPHSALLSKYCQVDYESGVYTKPATQGILYGTMTFVRSLIVHQARLALARAVTIAVRYTSIRRQFMHKDDRHGPEVPVLDYPTVQIRVLPLLATTYALHYTGLAMQETYKNTREHIERGEFHTLAHMHSMSSGLKSLCTNIVADGIETCRRALGGHGYGGASGFTRLGPDYLSRVTVEGDNWMITQQVASYLIKRMTEVAMKMEDDHHDELGQSFRIFLDMKQSKQSPIPSDIYACDRAVVDAFQQRATNLTYDIYAARVLEKRPWTDIMIQLHKASSAQSQAIMVNSFFNALETESTLPGPTKSTLWNLYRLFAFFTMESASYDFIRCGAVSQCHVEKLASRVQELMRKIRPHAVNLVDSWKIPDFLLDSALGRYDGKVYEDLFDRAHKFNPLNQVTFNPNYWEDEIVKGISDKWSSQLAKL